MGNDVCYLDALELLDVRGAEVLAPALGALVPAATWPAVGLDADPARGAADQRGGGAAWRRSCADPRRRSEGHEHAEATEPGALSRTGAPLLEGLGRFYREGDR